MARIRAPQAQRETTPLGPDKNVLSGEDVCRIIESCGKSNVRVLKFSGLHLRFGVRAEPKRQADPEPGPLELMQAIPASDPKILEEAAKIQRKTIQQQEAALRQQQLDELILSNPEEYERRMASGDLVDANDQSEEA